MNPLTEKRRPTMPTRLLVAAAILALGLGLWLGLQQFRGGPDRTPLQLRSGTLLPSPRPLQPFALTAHDGRPFDLERLRGHWTFLAIGYTHCPDVCPTTLATFDAIAKKVAASRTPPQFVFVSVDPERDTPEQLGRYVTWFNPAFVGATGPEPALRGLTTQLGLPYAKAEGNNTTLGYLVDHSATIMLIDPLARLAAIFSAPHDPVAMAQDFTTITTD
jgi:protein SCO1/2